MDLAKWNELMKLCLPDSPAGMTFSIAKELCAPEMPKSPNSLLLSSAKASISLLLKTKDIRSKVTQFFVDVPFNQLNCKFLQFYPDLLTEVLEKRFEQHSEQHFFIAFQKDSLDGFIEQNRMNLRKYQDEFREFPFIITQFEGLPSYLKFLWIRIHSPSKPKQKELEDRIENIVNFSTAIQDVRSTRSYFRYREPYNVCHEVTNNYCYYWGYLL